MSTDTPVLELAGVSKSYPGVRAVDNVDLAILAGEVHALVGENGAGKSTLIKILAGAVQPDAGTIWVRGDAVVLRSGSDAFARGLSFIHQELHLVPQLSGAENIFLGRSYPKTAFGTVDWRTLRAKATVILQQLGAAVPVNVPVRHLTRGQQTLIALARAFAGAASLVVMDEPTATLAAQEVENLFGVIRALRAQGTAVLYVSHRLEEVFALADRVTVMRNGRVVSTRRTNAIDESALIQQMIGRSLSESFPPRLGERSASILVARHLAGGPVRDVSFTVHAGEVLGVGGLVGAGRSKLLRLLFGADAIASGTLHLDGQPFRPQSPADAIARGVVLVPEERRTQGLILSRSVGDNLTLPHLDRFAAGRVWLRRTQEQREGTQIGEAVQLRARGLQQPVGQLSGGNQQKVVFARWLLRSPRVMLLDEPTRGIDVGARFEIYRLIRELAAQGMGIVLVSSDWQELLGMADRVVILREGRSVADVPTADLTPATALTYCYRENR